MYGAMRRELYCPHKAKDVCTTVNECCKCARNLTNKRKTQYLKLFPAGSALQIIAMDIRSPEPKTENGNKFLVAMTDQYSKLTRAMPTSKTRATLMATMFFQNSIVPFGIAAYLLTDNGTKFVRHFFETICDFLD